MPLDESDFELMQEILEATQETNAILQNLAEYIKVLIGQNETEN